MATKSRVYQREWMRRDYQRDPTKQKAAAARYWRKHHSRLIAKDKAERDKIAAIVKAAKSKPCADCWTSYPSYVMDFDHVRGQKKGRMADYARWKGRLQRLLDEIAKCDVVCSNCHRERTFGTHGAAYDHALCPRSRRAD